MSKELTPLFQRTVALVKKIPKGRVLTYSEVSKLIGASGCARHVSYILSSSSSKYKLPWHRVLNSKGMISLPVGNHYFLQKELLEREGVYFDQRDKIDLGQYLWRPKEKKLKSILGNLPTHTPFALRKL